VCQKPVRSANPDALPKKPEDRHAGQDDFVLWMIKNEAF